MMDAYSRDRIAYYVALIDDLKREITEASPTANMELELQKIFVYECQIMHLETLKFN